MKPINLSILALAAGSAFAAEVYTPVVWYITHNITGAGSCASADTYIAPTLVNATEFSGTSTSAPSGATISFSGGVPTGLDGSYVLEITSGANEGWWSTVVSSTSDSITVNDAFPDGAALDVAVRKHHAVGSFLGDNAIGLLSFDGASDSDEIQLFDPVTQSITSLAFIAPENLGDESYPNGAWVNLSTFDISNDAVIEPGTSLRVKRIGAADISYVSVGTVKTTKTQVDIYTGANFIGATQAAGGNLGNVGLNSLYQYDGSSTAYDEIQILNPDQSASIFAVVEDGGPQIYDLGSGDYANTTALDAGVGVIVWRYENAASTISLEGMTIAP